MNWFTQYISSSITKIFQRFPLSAVICLAFFAFVSYLIFAEKSYNENITYILLAMIVGFFLSMSVPLLQEKFKKNISIFGYIIVILYCIGFYFVHVNSSFSFEEFTMFALHLVAFGFFPFWISYSCRHTSEKSYNNFFIKIVHLLLISAGISLAIGIFGNIAIWAFGELFELSNWIPGGFKYWKIHAIWSLFSASIFCPFYILANFPILSDKNDNFTLGKTANFLIKYIEIPIIAIYFVILYAYSVKVLLNFWDWPKGIISYLVILFSFFGYFVFTNAKHFVEQSSLARIFVKSFPYAVLFQLPMLFYAIYLRINQYGLTTNRYIIIILGMILLAISLYFIFSRKKNIVVIPFLISFVAIFISIGPWGIFALPQHLQFENFKKNIEILGLFKDGKFTKFDENIHDINVKNQIIGQLEYLCNYKNKCQKLKPYFGDAIPEKSPYYDSNSLFIKDIDNNEEGGKINHWEIQRFLEDEMNLSKNWLINEKDEYRRINIMGKKSSELLVDIRGYDYQMPLGYAGMDEIMMKEALWKGKIDGNSLGEFALKEFLQNILKKIEVTKNRTEYFVDEISFTTENDDFAIKMIPNYLPIDYKSDDDFYFGSTHLEGILLIKDKKGILENALQK